MSTMELQERRRQRPEGRAGWGAGKRPPVPRAELTSSSHAPPPVLDPLPHIWGPPHGCSQLARCLYVCPSPEGMGWVRRAHVCQGRAVRAGPQPRGQDHTGTRRESGAEAGLTTCSGSVSVCIRVTFCSVCGWGDWGEFTGRPRGPAQGTMLGWGAGAWSEGCAQPDGPWLAKPSLGARRLCSRPWLYPSKVLGPWLAVADSAGRAGDAPPLPQIGKPDEVLEPAVTPVCVPSGADGTLFKCTGHVSP